MPTKVRKTAAKSSTTAMARSSGRRLCQRWWGKCGENKEEEAALGGSEDSEDSGGWSSEAAAMKSDSGEKTRSVNGDISVEMKRSAETWWRGVLSAALSWRDLMWLSTRTSEVVGLCWGRRRNCLRLTIVVVRRCWRWGRSSGCGGDAGGDGRSWRGRQREMEVAWSSLGFLYRVEGDAGRRLNNGVFYFLLLLFSFFCPFHLFDFFWKLEKRKGQRRSRVLEICGGGYFFYKRGG